MQICLSSLHLVKGGMSTPISPDIIVNIIPKSSMLCRYKIHIFSEYCRHTLLCYFHYHSDYQSAVNWGFLD